MARRKSINDMQSQLNRIISYGNASMSRINKATATYRRYRSNIQSALGYSNRGRGVGALNSSNMRFSNQRMQSIGAINARRVSRGVYMGLNVG